MKLLAHARFQNFVFLLRYAKPYAWDFCAGIFFVLTSTGAILLMGSVIREFLHFLGTEEATQLQQTTFKAFGLISLAALAVFGRIRFFGTLGEKLINDVKDAVFKHLMKMDIAFFEDRKTGDLLSIILSDTYVVHSVFIYSASAILRNLVMLVGSVIMMLLIQPWLFSGIFCLVVSA